MSKKMYALVGKWNFSPGSKGLSVYSYDPETVAMELIDTLFDDVNVGQQCIDTERNIVYIVNECSSRRGQTGGGGYVMAIKIDPETGRLALINEKESLAPEPSYICLDKTKRYALVAHHVDHGHVTKIVKNKDGSYSSETQFDDCALVLLRINEDGSLGDVCDVSVTQGEGVSGPHMIPHQHSVISDPTGELFVVCDKGMDKIYTYRLDREKGKLVLLHENVVETGMAPRYGVFHPTLPVFFENNERKTVGLAYRYDVTSGKLDQISSASLLLNEKAAEGIKKVEPSDILIHPNGKHLYISVRGVNCIAVLDVNDTGSITLRQNISCGGENPRGLCISPDARCLFATNTESGNITAFSIGNDGFLSAIGTVTKTSCPGNMIIFAVKNF